MLKMSALLPPIALLEACEPVLVRRPDRPWSVVAAGAVPSDEDARWSPHARLIRLAWLALTYAESAQAIFGSEPILVGPGEDLEAAQARFCLERLGELAEAHPAGTVALFDGPLPVLESASEELLNTVWEALGRIRGAGASLLGFSPHPCPALFEGCLRPGERSAWSRSDSLLWCCVHLGEQVVRLEAYELDPWDYDRVVAIAVDQLHKGFPKAEQWAVVTSEPFREARLGRSRPKG